ncbi:DUF7289 family protein [Halolamina salifodinae]|uniref:Flagellin-like protein n=1 Tax=Halolamina salifodinae TaxID=1202767 RepID=A0A8T4GWA2_9EURY|nr:archaellin/type IV pilin N-terminal domain-containing protein [Halolamina salifodinae]MBP1986730.1 flagellin-like protein [Halolamina salifodinae]
MRPDSVRGQSSVVGVVLLLGITIIGTGAIVTIGAQAFADTERTATISQAEHSLTQFDSKAAVVALGESHSQRVDLGSSGRGKFVSETDSGWMRVVHHNATGTGDNETIYNATLGSVSYRNEDVEVGYQGGGVWERRGNGSVMRSPPEFNYRGATLTLPVVRVTSDQQAAGRTTAIVTQANESRRLFPNETTDGNETWDDEGAPYGDNTTYANPVTSGNVTVTVQSRFYQGWAEFFRTRTTGDVTVDHGNEMATVELVTADTVGEFALADAMDENGVTARGQAPEHSLTDFNVTFVSDGGNDFNNHYTGFYAESGPHRFEYVVHVPQGNPSNLELRMFYRNTDTGAQHEWVKSSIPIDSRPIRLEERSGETHLIVNLTAGNATDGVNLTYKDTTPGETYYNWSGNASSQAEFNHTDEDGEDSTFETGNETTTYHLSRHYIALLGEEFTINARSSTGGSGNGAQLDLDASRGNLDYESRQGGTYITYLHITENEVEVELE